MKYFIMLWVLLGIVSCENNVQQTNQVAPSLPEYKGSTHRVLIKGANWKRWDCYFNYMIINIDGCEYIYVDQRLLHKANCPNHGHIQAEKQ